MKEHISKQFFWYIILFLIRFINVYSKKKIYFQNFFYQGLSGGSTVSGTMIAAHHAGISVFVTGGIGGVHRDGENSKYFVHIHVIDTKRDLMTHT